MLAELWRSLPGTGLSLATTSRVSTQIRLGVPGPPVPAFYPSQPRIIEDAKDAAKKRTVTRFVDVG
jgi:hypothetical protein